jgi:ribonuclease HI
LLKALALIEERWADKTTGGIQGNVGEILIRSDSQLVVNQVNGAWRVEDSKLIELSEEAKYSIGKIGSVRLEWVPREENYAGLWLEGKLKPFSIERMRG